MARRRQTVAAEGSTVTPSIADAAPTVGRAYGAPATSTLPAPVRVREARVTYGPAMRARPAPLRSSVDVAAFVGPLIADSAVERFAVVVVDTRGRPVCWGVVAVGTISHCPVSVAEILRFVLLAGGETFVVSHNHPSGDPSPSAEDVTLTRRLVDAARTVGLRMLDHVIVADRPFGAHGPHPFASFMDAGLLAPGGS